MSATNGWHGAGRLTRDVTFNKGAKETQDRAWGTVACANGPDRPPTYVNFTAWGGRARGLAQYTEKGQMLIIDGEFESRRIEQNDGSFKDYFGIKVTDVIFGAKSKKSQGGDIQAMVAAEVDRRFNQSPDLAPECEDQTAQSCSVHENGELNPF